jgi:hypothetical protein
MNISAKARGLWCELPAASNYIACYDSVAFPLLTVALTARRLNGLKFLIVYAKFFFYKLIT